MTDRPLVDSQKYLEQGYSSSQANTFAWWDFLALQRDDPDQLAPIASSPGDSVVTEPIYQPTQARPARRSQAQSMTGRMHFDSLGRVVNGRTIRATGPIRCVAR